MKELFDFILRFGNLNPQQIDFIKSKGQEIDYQKDEYFSEAGKIASQVGFVVEGILRVCYYNNEGEFSLRTLRNGLHQSSVIEFGQMLAEQGKAGDYKDLELR